MHRWVDERLSEAIDGLEKAAEELDASRLPSTSVDALLRSYARIEKLAAAGTLTLAATLEGRRAARELAALSGSSVGRARDVIETGKRLADQPAVDAAVRAGRLSLAQASEVAAGVGKDPSAAPHLLAVAATSTLAALRDEVRRIIAGAEDDPDAAYAAVHASRMVRHRSCRDGAVEGSFRLAPDHGGLAMTALEAEADRRYRAAYAKGESLTHDQALADAFVALLTGEGSGGGVGVKMIVKVDVTAEGGPRAEVRGGSPLPMSRVQALLDNAFVAGIVEDGIDVMLVKHFGRRPSAAQRTALEWLFDGCSEPGCDRRLGTENDHVEPWSNGGPTTIRNLKPKCRPDHHDKTQRDWAEGRIRSRRPSGAAPPIRRQ